MTTKLIELDVTGVREIERKLGYSLLVDPAMDDVVETIAARIVDRPGKGEGAQANELRRDSISLGARISSTLKNPRQTGSSWQRKNQQIVNAMAPRVVDKAIRQIESTWSK